MDWNKQRWVWQTSQRYIWTRRKDKGNSSFILSLLGITLGVMALLTILSVMNGFQQNYITNINEVVSYHIRVDNQGEPLPAETLLELNKLPWIQTITPFTDVQTMITGILPEPGGGLIRGIPPEALNEDQSLKEHLDLWDGTLDLSEERSIILGNELARSLGLFPGDKVNLMTLKGGEFSRLAVSQEEFQVKGLFKTGYREYDKSLGFISLNDAVNTMDSAYITYGIKILNNQKDQYYLRRLKKLESLSDCTLTTWRDYNTAFFSALLMEKIMMILMVSLIFIVVAVNIFNSLKRTVAERIEEIALYKAMGAGPWQVRMIFLLQGTVLSVGGTALGLLIGYLLSSRINQVFRFVEKIVNGVIDLLTRIFTGQEVLADFSIYSSRDFYLTKVPVIIMGADMSVIALAAISFTLLAALMATSRVALVRPAEVFGYE